MTYENEKKYLVTHLKDLMDDQTRAYLLEPEFGGFWGLLFHEPDGVMLSASFDGVDGLRISSSLKPDKVHGTGYVLYKEDPLSDELNIPSISELSQRAMSCLYADIARYGDPMWKLMYPDSYQQDLAKKDMYSGPEEYFELRCSKGIKITEIKTDGKGRKNR